MMTLADFKKQLPFSIEDVCRDFFHHNRDLVRIKKEAVAVKNLVAIIDTTLKLSNRKGFDAMSIRDLSRESGLSLGALYAYFSSKDELLHLIQHQGQQMVKTILLRQINHDSDPRTRLAEVIRTHLYLSELMQDWFCFFFMETKRLKKTSRRIPMESELFTEKVIVDILEEGREKGVFAVEDPLLTGSVVKAMMQDWYLKRWKYTGRRISVEAYADFVVRFVEAFILPARKKERKRRQDDGNS